MGKKIIVDLDDKGNLNAETFGFTGHICFDEFDKLFADIVKERPYHPKKDDASQVTASVNSTISSSSGTTQTQYDKNKIKTH